ncbi:kinase-like protein [Pluteus cervinus]|uniref:Kinase-like protein n=1 Tax=Pluteus cervinus TaxID=181527 RepID=A0ACD3B886_9AGAR|nr:kinase-like protein [Pluteus cervinus]
MTQDVSHDTQPDSTAPKVRAPPIPEPDDRLRKAQQAAAALEESEYFWRDRAVWLEAQGYKLRPRYQPGWEPVIPLDGDGLLDENLGSLARASIVDAIRVKDGKRVLLKRVDRSEWRHELETSRLFSTEPLASDPRNHCIPLEDVISPPDEPDLKFIVFPFLQQLVALPFDTIGEIVDFLRQVFTGLQFMHHHHVAHRDIGEPNVMMDGDELFPDGWNPKFASLLPNGEKFTKVFTRTQLPPKYYLIDFGLSRRYDPSDPNPLEEPVFGGDRTVPEFKTGKEAYNPFQTDIYYMGNMIRRLITEGLPPHYIYCKGYYGTGFLRPLIKDMTQADPEKRPTIDEVIARFDKMCKGLSTWKLRSRPIPRRGGIIKGLCNHIEHWKRRRDYSKRGVPPIPSRQLPAEGSSNP